MLKELFDAICNLTKAGTIIPRPDGGSVVLLANGTTRDIEPLAKALPHVRQTVALGDATSFSEYFNRFKNENSVILADDSAHPPRIVGVIDYHHVPAEGASVAKHGEHTLHLSPAYSEQYARWRGIDQQQLSQVAFLEFLEENYLDVTAPDAAALLEQVMNLEAKTDVTFKSSVRLADGSTSLVYSEDVKTGSGQIEGRASFPSKIRIKVPMFGGFTDAELTDLDLLLRFRIVQGKLSFMVKINRRDLIEREAAQDLIRQIQSETEAPVFAGKLSK